MQRYERVCAKILDRARRGRDEYILPFEKRSAEDEYVTSHARHSALLLFFVSGPALIFLNKYILNDLEFPFPSLLTFFGVAATAIATNTIKISSTAQSKHVERADPLSPNLIFAISFMQACSLVSGQAAYLHLGAGIIQILKTSTIVVTVLLAVLARVSALPSWEMWVVVLIITAGVLISSLGGDTTLSGFGVFMMMTSVFAESARCVFSQCALQEDRPSKLCLLAKTTPITSFVTLLSFLSFELDTFRAHGGQAILFHWHVFLLSSILAFLVQCISSFSFRVADRSCLLTLIFSSTYVSLTFSHHEHSGQFCLSLGD